MVLKTNKLSGDPGRIRTSGLPAFLTYRPEGRYSCPYFGGCATPTLKIA